MTSTTAADTQAQAAACLYSAKLANYLNHLRTHDWWHEFSDSAAVWRAGHASAQELRIAQADLDPTGEHWNSIAPAPFRLERTPAQPPAQPPADPICG